MHAVGVDVGYGHTKAVSSLRDRPLTFPSVVGRAEAKAYRLDLNGHDHTPLRGGVLTGANDDVYLYGEPAIRYARIAHQPRDRDWIRSQPYRVLWEAVVTELLLPSTHPIIVTGLPVRYYSADRPVLEEVVQQVLYARNLRPRLVIVVPSHSAVSLIISSIPTGSSYPNGTPQRTGASLTSAISPPTSWKSMTASISRRDPGRSK
jgi:hypothetical protein